MNHKHELINHVIAKNNYKTYLELGIGAAKETWKQLIVTILRSRLAQLQLEQHQERISQLKGPNQSAEWGNQIRSYVLHPYKQVKDLRSRYETSDVEGVLDGKLDAVIDAYLEHTMGEGGQS